MKTFSFLYPNSLKVNSPTHVCLRRNYYLLMITMHLSYFKYNNLLHMLNVYKILSK